MPDLSIIIPAFNESTRIGATLDAVIAYCSRVPYVCEIVVVDDGSHDDTGQIVREKSSGAHPITLITLPKNRGKGAAVRAGMLAARGKSRLFMDADNSTSVDQVSALLSYRSEYDVIIGSRRMRGAVIALKQSILREILGMVFRAITTAIVPLGVSDTQNGFKLFSHTAAEDIFSRLETEGWSFDVEALLRARMSGYRVKEVPIVWRNDAGSKVRFAHMPRMLADVVRIRMRVR